MYGFEIVAYLLGLFLFGGIIAILIGFFASSGTAVKRIFTKIGFYWLGIVLYFFVSLLICLIVRHILWQIFKNKGYSVSIARQITVAVVLAFTFAMSIYGIFNAHHLYITNYEVEIDKTSSRKELNIALVSDLHLGYNVGLDEMQDMVNKINGLNSDVVIIAGDIFDNEYEAIKDPEKIIDVLKQINAEHKYAILGNHDIEEKILMGFTFDWSKQKIVEASSEMIDFIKESGFTLLYDSYEMIDDIYIYGRPDQNKINLGNSSRLSPIEISKTIDTNKPVIVIDHAPGQLQELADVGVDLDLSGHTHNGQVWPGTLTINLFWDNAYGLLQVGKMKSIVTSGVGLFGVNMRTGCIAEIANIKVKLK